VTARVNAAGLIAVVAVELALGACGGSPPTRYWPARAPANWCRVGDGTYAFLWYPTTRPPLVGDGCETLRERATDARDRAVVSSAPRSLSSLAELVVGPGSAIEIPIELPPVLAGASCRLDSVVLAHGKTPADLAIALRLGADELPVVHYAQLPPAIGDAPVVTSTGPTAPGADLPGADLPVPVARMPREPPFITVADIPGTPAPAPTPDPSLTEVDLDLSIAGWSAGLTFVLDPDARAADASAGVTPGPVHPLEFFAVRHRIGVAVPDRFSIIVRAGALPFAIAVRSDRESSDPTLTYLAASSVEPVPTHFVPQAAVVLSSCRRPATDTLDGIGPYQPRGQHRSR